MQCRRLSQGCFNLWCEDWQSALAREGGAHARRTASGIGVDVCRRFTARHMDLRYGCKSKLTNQHAAVRAEHAMRCIDDCITWSSRSRFSRLAAMPLPRSAQSRAMRWSHLTALHHEVFVNRDMDLWKGG